MSVTKIEFGDFILPKAFDPTWKPNITIRTPIGVTTRSPSRNFDFSDYKTDHGRLTEILFWIAHAFAQWAVGKQASTIQERFKALRHYFEYLSEFEKGIQRLIDISPTAVDSFCLWVKHKEGWGLHYKRRVWSVPNQLLVLLRQCRPELIRSDLPNYRFSMGKRGHPASSRMIKEVLTKSELGLILSSLRTEIVGVRETMQKYHREISTALSAGYDGDRLPDPASIGELLVWLKAEYLRGSKRKPFDLLRYHVFRKRLHGFADMDEVYRHILLGHDQLLPYFILIGAYTGANTSSLMNFDIGCVDAGVGSDLNKNAQKLIEAVAGERDYVFWDKKRSGYSQSASFRRGMNFLPPQLIEELILLTTPFRPLIATQFRNKLFIADGGRRGPSWISQATLPARLKEFRTKHKLAYFTLRTLRSAFINYGFLVSNGNIQAVQRLANHRSSDTTQNVYLGTVAKRQNDETLSKLHIRFVTWLRTGADTRSVRKSVVSDSSQQMSIADAWFELLSSPNTIVLTSRFRIAHILQLREHLAAAKLYLHPLRWTARCRPLFDLIEKQLLPIMDREEIAAANQIRQSFPPLPPIE